MWRRCNIDVIIPISVSQTLTPNLSSHQLILLGGRGYLTLRALFLSPRIATSPQLNHPPPNHPGILDHLQYDPSSSSTLQGNLIPILTNPDQPSPAQLADILSLHLSFASQFFSYTSYLRYHAYSHSINNYSRIAEGKALSIHM